jgi:archaellum component FlaC
MKFKDKVISNLDGVSNRLYSLKNMIENNGISPELLMKELEKLKIRVDDVSSMVGLEDNDFTVLRQGINI